MVSCHRAKHVPRSASTSVTRGSERDRVEPLSCSSTGTPVYTRRQSFWPQFSYRLASDGHTKICGETQCITQWVLMGQMIGRWWRWWCGEMIIIARWSREPHVLRQFPHRVNGIMGKCALGVPAMVIMFMRIYISYPECACVVASCIFSATRGMLLLAVAYNASVWMPVDSRYILLAGDGVHEHFRRTFGWLGARARVCGFQFKYQIWRCCLARRVRPLTMSQPTRRVCSSSRSENITDANDTHTHTLKKHFLPD